MILAKLTYNCTILSKTARIKECNNFAFNWNISSSTGWNYKQLHICCMVSIRILSLKFRLIKAHLWISNLYYAKATQRRTNIYFISLSLKGLESNVRASWTSNGEMDSNQNPLRHIVQWVTLDQSFFLFLPDTNITHHIGFLCGYK